MSHPSKIAELRHFFTLLEARCVEYCVVGDHRHLHEHVHSDVDIVVPTARLKEVPDLMATFARANELALVQDIQHEATARYFVFSWQDEGAAQHFLHLDVCGDWLRGGRLFMSAAEILADREFDERIASDGQPIGFWRPAPAVNFRYYLLKKMDKGNLSAEQADLLRDEFIRAPFRVVADLARYFSSPSRELIVAYIESDQWEALGQSLRRFQPDMRVGRIRRLAEWTRRLLRQWRPTGLLLVVPKDAHAFESISAHVESIWSQAFRRIALARRQRTVGWWYYWRRVRQALVRSTLVLVEAPKVGTTFGKMSDALTLSADECEAFDALDRHIGAHLFARLRRRPNGKYL